MIYPIDQKFFEYLDGSVNFFYDFEKVRIGYECKSDYDKESNVTAIADWAYSFSDETDHEFNGSQIIALTDVFERLKPHDIICSEANVAPVFHSHRKY